MSTHMSTHTHTPWVNLKKTLNYHNQQRTLFTHNPWNRHTQRKWKWASDCCLGLQQEELEKKKVVSATWFLFRGRKSLKLVVLKAAEAYNCIKHHYILDFKWVNYIVHEYLNKPINKKENSVFTPGITWFNWYQVTGILYCQSIQIFLSFPFFVFL